MTEAKPNMSHRERLQPVDATSHPRKLGVKTVPEVDSVASRDNAKVGTARVSENDWAADETVDDKDEADKEPEEEGRDEDEEDEESDDEDDDEEDEEEDDEPRLKYARLTQHLGPVYRNGDSTSAFLVAGDKMIVGTHKGNIVRTPSSFSNIAKCPWPRMLTSP